LQRATAALAANRLTEPAGDNALELFKSALAAKPDDAAAQTGLAEVHERLLARVENALLEERLDEATSALEAARKAGIANSRISFLSVQLAKSRSQKQAAEAKNKADNQQRNDDTQGHEALRLASARISEGRLLEPVGDSARDHLNRARQLAPNDPDVAQQATQFGARLLQEARSAIARRDQSAAERLIGAARGFASGTDIDAASRDLAASRARGVAEERARIFGLANERVSQDRLIEPASDNAKFYLLSLRDTDPNYPGLPAALQELGSRLVVKARRAQSLQQYSAAQRLLDEARSLGYSSAEMTSVTTDIKAAVEQEKFRANIVPAGAMQRVRGVDPVYPPEALKNGREGWVELDFTVDRSGAVKDVVIHAAEPSGTFEKAAADALARWRFKPTLRDGVAVEQRSRVRMKFKIA
jgi:TonB family protein